MGNLTTAAKALLVKNTRKAFPELAAAALLDAISDTVYVKKLSAVAAYDDFTDNLDATGTYDFASDLPAGATVIAVACTALIGFAGDTSAVMVLGDGSYDDRYMTGTPDVFSDASGGIALGAISGAPFHLAAKTPAIIVTSGADFSSVNAGSISLDIYYIEAND